MLIHKSSKSLLLKVKPDTYTALRTLLPNHSRPINYDGHNIAVKHDLTTTKILRNLKIKAPGPARAYYDFPRPPRFTTVFDHQYETVDFLTMHEKCFVLNEMGTSKTASAIWAADYLMKLGLVRKVVIVSPLSTLEHVWLNEIFDVAMHRTALVLHGSADRRRLLLSRDVDFYIINPAGLGVIKAELEKRTDIDLFIVDEAADYRNSQTQQYEILHKLTRKRRLWLMTGAPCPTAPTDAWALARLVNPNRVPQYFTEFKRKTMQQVTTYKWVPKQGSHLIAFEALQPAIRFKKSDCISLPPVTYQTRHVGLSQEQAKAYDQMKAHLVAAAGTQVVTAANAADQASKLRQILCGAIKNPDGTYTTIGHKPRFDELTACIQQAAAKVLVIAPFKGITRALTEELNDWHAKNGDGKRCAMVNGDVSLTDRSKIFQDFRDDPDLNELVCHPKVMSHGLTLIEADMVVFYAPIYSNDQTVQVENRINRPGQVHHMTIVRLQANAFEQSIYSLVQSRQMTQQSMLDLYKREIGLSP